MSIHWADDLQQEILIFVFPYFAPCQVLSDINQQKLRYKTSYTETGLKWTVTKLLRLLLVYFNVWIFIATI